MSVVENAASGPYTVGDHLVDRLAELGADRVSGCPATKASGCSTAS